MARPRRWETSDVRLLALIHSHPGITTRTLADRLGIHPTTAEYHLRRLAREGRINRAMVRNQGRHYAAGSGLCARARAVHAALTPETRRVLEHLAEHGRIAPRQLIAWGLTRAQVRWCFEVLGRAGAVVRDRPGVYVLVEEERPCILAALGERACRRCHVLGTA